MRFIDFPEYKTWQTMRNRCISTQLRHKCYRDLGIKVCPAWLHFPAFYRDMGPKPSPTHQIYTARYDFCPPEINMAIFLPKKSEYVNIHPNCFHVHQVRDEELPEGLIL